MVNDNIFMDIDFQNESKKFIEKFGGHFFLCEPDGGLMYECDDNMNCYKPPYNYTKKELINILHNSIDKNLILTQWEIDMDIPECYY